MKKSIALILVLTFAAVTPSFAYKEEVHRFISLKAFDRMLAGLKANVGVDKNGSAGGFPLRALVAQGSFDEDAGNRSLNHFYDPVHDAALRVPVLLCIPLGQTARNWGVDGLGENEFSTTIAREDYETAVLGPDAATRDAALMHLFLSLGHSIHLVQDMAQPEHTRNDQHLPGSQLVLKNGTEASLYEEWSLANVLPPQSLVSFDGYPNISLPTAFDYFSNAKQQGLADFANNWFVTQDTNYDDEKESGHCEYYTLPNISVAAGRTQEVSEAVRDDVGGIFVVQVQERIFTSNPVDHYAGVQETDPFHTFLSSVDLETRLLVAPEKYSLGDASYLTRASMLIPRAVGYSAGYLDHFFRGKINVVFTPNRFGTYDVTVTNLSKEKIGSDARIRAVYAPGSSYLGINTDTAVLLDNPIAYYVSSFNGLGQLSSVTIPNVPIFGLQPGDSVNDFERRVVIRGTLGSEYDDVIGFVEPKPAPIGGNRIVMDRFHAWNNTVTLDAIGIDGDGSLVTLAPPSADGTWYGGLLSGGEYLDGSSLAPDGKTFVVQPQGNDSYVNVFQLGDLTNVQTILPRRLDGWPVRLDSRVSWTNQSLRFVAISVHTCNDADSPACFAGFDQLGVAYVDPFTGTAEWHRFPQFPNWNPFQGWPAAVMSILGSTTAMSGDDQFLYFVPSDASAAGRINLADFTVSFVATPPAGLSFAGFGEYPFVLRSDGSLMSLGLNSPSGYGFYTYDWTNATWSQPFSFVQTSSLARSPNSPEFAYVKGGPCGQDQVWIYNFATNTQRPASTSCGNEVQFDRIRWIAWPKQ
jgi:hypothetical protein